MKIAFIAHNDYPITETCTGEKDLFLLDLIASLKREGIGVVLFAQEGSQVDCELYNFNTHSVDWQYDEDVSAAKRKEVEDQHAYAEAFQLLASSGVDVVHNFSLHPWPIYTAQFLPMPSVTLLAQKPVALLQNAVKLNTHRHSYYISPTYYFKSLWESYTPINEVIYQGVDTVKWKFRNAYEEKQLIYWGPIERSGKLDELIKVCQENGWKLWIVGEITNKAYFEYMIQSSLNTAIVYLGDLAEEQVVPYLGSAQAAVFLDEKSTTPENILKSLSCGTPVSCIAHERFMEYVPASCGSLIYDLTKETLKQAIVDSLQKDRKDCRSFIEGNFTVQQGVDTYQLLYQKIINQFQANKKVNAYS